jgi:hypothetical protein
MSAENRLTKLFENARTADPDMPLESIEKLMELKGTRINHYKKLNIFKSLFVMSVLLIVFTSLFLFLNKPVFKEKLVENPTPSIEMPKELSKESFAEPVKEPPPAIQNLIVNYKEIKSPINLVEANEYLSSELSVKVQVQKNFIQSDRPFAYRAINISNLSVIELTNEELLKFGISIEDKRIKVPICNSNISSYYFKEGTEVIFKMDHMELNGPVPIINPEKITPEKMSFTAENSSSVILKMEDNEDSTQGYFEENNFPYYPLITDDLGQKWRCYEVDDGLTEEDKEFMRANNLNEQTWEKAIKGRKEGERKLIEKLPSFVPILVRSGDVNTITNDSLWRADIIIWFEPSEELFNALPARISTDLRKEYQSVFGTKTRSTQSCKYFEACQNAPGTIDDVKVFPNPSDAELNVQFSIKVPRKMDANIYTINGTLVKKVSIGISFEAGTHNLQTSMADMLPGVYVLELPICRTHIPRNYY